MDKKKIISTVLSVVTLAGVSTGAVETVTNVVEKVEQVQYQERYEIVEGQPIYVFVDKDGNEYELTFDQYNNLKGEILKTEEEPVEEECIKIYAGATDEIPTSLDELSEIKVNELGDRYEIKITAGYGAGRYAVGQYPVFAMPKEYTISKWTVPGAEFLAIPFSKVELEEYNLFYLDLPSYDCDLGGNDYIIFIEAA